MLLVKVTHMLTGVCICTQRGSYLHATYPAAVKVTQKLVRVWICHATYTAGIVSESYSYVDESLDIQLNGYLHTTLLAGSVSENYP